MLTTEVKLICLRYNEQVESYFLSEIVKTSSVGGLRFDDHESQVNLKCAFDREYTAVFSMCSEYM